VESDTLPREFQQVLWVWSRGKFMSYKTSLMGASSALVIALMNQASAVQAADVADNPLCAVSDVNGKVEIIGGYSENDDENGDALLSGLGSLSFPLGCDFGLQLDAGIVDELNQTTYGGAAHLFTRNPDSYLFGVTGGYFNSGDADIWAVGPEAELYAGPVSFEAWAGYVDLDSDSDIFAIADAAFYPTEDLRLSVGGTIIGDQEFLRAEMEYQFAAPITASLGAKIGENDYFAVSAGLSFYFGGSDKSLIRRHREDDPRNRILDFVGFTDTDDAGTTGTGTGTGTSTPTSTFGNVPE
jgi:hypothetical protein